MKSYFDEENRMIIVKGTVVCICLIIFAALIKIPFSEIFPDYDAYSSDLRDNMYISINEVPFDKNCYTDFSFFDLTDDSQKILLSKCLSRVKINNSDNEIASFVKTAMIDKKVSISVNISIPDLGFIYEQYGNFQLLDESTTNNMSPENITNELFNRQFYKTGKINAILIYNSDNTFNVKIVDIPQLEKLCVGNLDEEYSCIGDIFNEKVGENVVEKDISNVFLSTSNITTPSSLSNPRPMGQILYYESCFGNGLKTKLELSVVSVENNSSGIVVKMQIKCVDSSSTCTISPETFYLTDKTGEIYNSCLNKEKIELTSEEKNIELIFKNDTETGILAIENINNKDLLFISIK